MSELIGKLGLDWKLLLAQAVNFLVILIVLRLTLYKPLVRILWERRERIEQGLRDAENAGTRLQEVEAIGKERLAEKEKEAMQVMARAEAAGKQKEAELLASAKTKEVEVLQNAARLAEARGKEAEEKFLKDAQSIVREAMVKVAHLAPKALDESLIQEAVDAVRKTKQ